jgi:hypothetical protein
VLRQGPEGSPSLSPHPQRVCRHNPMQRVPFATGLSFRSLSKRLQRATSGRGQGEPEGRLELSGGQLAALLPLVLAHARFGR